MNNLFGFTLFGTRLVPNFSNNDRGIAVQKGFRKWIAVKLGSGTIGVTFKVTKTASGFRQALNVSQHINRGSCYKYVTDKGNRSRKDRKNFLKKTDKEIVELVQNRYIQTNDRIESLQVKTEPPKNQKVGSPQLNLATYNVLFSQKEGDHQNKFNTPAGYSQDHTGNVKPNDAWRLELKTKSIISANPDTLALQEITDEEFKHYQRALPGYVGVFSGTHTDLVSHGVAIFYKADQFQLLGAQKGSFQGQKRENGVLKKTKKGLPSYSRRSHLLLDLQDKKTGTIVRVVSCHLVDPRDWIGHEKSAHAAAVVKHALEKSLHYKVDLVAVCGDMNQDQFGDDPTNKRRKDIKSITAFRPFAHQFVHDNSKRPTEYDKNPNDPNGFNGLMQSTKRKIDWIFLKKSEEVALTQKPVRLDWQRLTEQHSELTPGTIDIRGSDHILTMTQVIVHRFKNG